MASPMELWVPFRYLSLLSPTEPFYSNYVSSEKRKSALVEPFWGASHVTVLLVLAVVVVVGDVVPLSFEHWFAVVRCGNVRLQAWLP